MRGAIVLAILTTAGCANPFGFRPTMASDPPLTGGESIVLQNELMRAYETLPGEICRKTALSAQERGSKAIIKHNRAKTDAADAFRCLAFRTTTDDAAVARHVHSGVALTDLYCDTFFDRISERAAKRRFGRSTTNDVGAAITAVLGLATAGSGVTGGVGAGFGLADGIWRNYDESFLVHADLPALQKLVRSKQSEIYGEYKKAMPTTYAEATTAILRYANTCSFTGMRGLFTAAMLAQAGENNPQDGSRIDAAVQSALDNYERRRADREAARNGGARQP